LTGAVVGIAVDLNDGSMQVNIGKGWINLFHSALLPGEKIGSGLFPAISAGAGKKVRYNWGFDLENRPLFHAPPSPDFLPYARAVNIQVCQCHC
jgi:hypothetical protein